MDVLEAMEPVNVLVPRWVATWVDQMRHPRVLRLDLVEQLWGDWEALPGPARDHLQRWTRRALENRLVEVAQRERLFTLEVHVTELWGPDTYRLELLALLVERGSTPPPDRWSMFDDYRP